MPSRRGLTDYRRKRDFATTPEPEGGAARPRRHRGRPRFVVHEHHARSLHWDLRLERDGVLASWAIPKGIPPDPRRNHLAVRTEDHPLEYLTFRGEIPAGEYGAGTMMVWDRGTYEAEKWESGEVILTFDGERLHGRHALFRTGGDQWMIHRMDPPDDPDRASPPPDLRPMLARASTSLPAGDTWAFEIKWDGIRALARVEGGRIRLTSRSGNDITERYPELRPLGEQLGSTEAVLDGEIVAFDGDGRPSFERLQRRMHVAGASTIRRLAREVPVVYVIFDLLWLDGRPLLDAPYAERRRLLAGLHLDGPAWQTPPHEVGGGDQTLAVSRRFGLEGVVAKRLDSRYEPGRRSGAWRKIKLLARQELVVGGWLPGEGRRATTIGSLLVGYYDERGALRFAGRVGTGFTERTLRELRARLEPRRRATSPFGDRGLPKDAVFVEPEVVAEVRFSGWTAAGRVRQPAYLGLRDDKDPREVVREPVPPPPTTSAKIRS